MGVPSEDVVEIEVAKQQGEPSVVTVNCPDETGLGCDLSRVVLEFGLCITRGDVSTDGKWCFVVLWVLPCSPNMNIPWMSLKERLFSLCPSNPIPFYFDVGTRPTVSQTYLLKLFSVDRKGLLHDVTHVLSELELLIQRVKVSTTPDGRVMDLFFITDGMELLHTKKRQDETCERLNDVLGDSCISCEFQLADGFQQGFSSLPPSVAEELFRPEITEGEVGSQALSPDMRKLKKVNVVIDNSLSPSQTLLQIHCVDQKGLLYDILRTMKDCDIKIAYGRFLSEKKGYREIDLFLQQADGKKIVDPEKQNTICSQLRLEMLHPLRVIIVSRGPDTELLVANPVELSGKGRPRVFYDVTLALKVLGICIFSVRNLSTSTLLGLFTFRYPEIWCDYTGDFGEYLHGEITKCIYTDMRTQGHPCNCTIAQAEIGRHTTAERQWEIYRFLLEETREYPLANKQARSKIIDRVRRTLMGW